MNIPQKVVVWDFDDGYNLRPTVAEIVEAAQKEFPGIPFEQLEIDLYGEDIMLKRR